MSMYLCMHTFPYTEQLPPLFNPAVHVFSAELQHKRLLHCKNLHLSIFVSY